MVAAPRVEGIYLKPRMPGEYGLPKRSVLQAEILTAGLRGDYNNYRQEELHGDLDSAVLVLPREVEDALRSEGWPVRPGDLGENLLLREVPYAELTPPRELRVGTEVRLVTTRACDPCRRLSTLPYVGGERLAEFQRTTLHRRGWYARVVQPGLVRVGDPIVLA